MHRHMRIGAFVLQSLQYDRCLFHAYAFGKEQQMHSVSDMTGHDHAYAFGTEKFLELRHAGLQVGRGVPCGWFQV